MLGVTEVLADDPADQLLREFGEEIGAVQTYAKTRVGVYFGEAGVESDDDIGGTNVSIEIDGWDLFGLVGLNFGPFGVFAKAGVVSWDAEANIGGFSVDDDGTDPAYGAGARFQLGSFQIRGEFEQFDVSDVDDVYLLSVSALYTF